MPRGFAVNMSLTSTPLTVPILFEKWLFISKEVTMRSSTCLLPTDSDPKWDCNSWSHVKPEARGRILSGSAMMWNSGDHMGCQYLKQKRTLPCYNTDAGDHFYNLKASVTGWYLEYCYIPVARNLLWPAMMHEISANLSIVVAADI